jgi:hypothetical protein
MPETVNNPQSTAGAPPHEDDEVLPMVVATGSSDIPTTVKAPVAPVATIIGEGGGGFAPPPATAVTATGAPGKAWGAAPGGDGGDGGDGKEGQIRMIATEECAVVALSEGEGETKLSSFDSNDGGDDDDDDDDALYAEGDGALVLLGDAGSEDECGDSTEDSSLAMTHSSFGKCPCAECLYLMPFMPF